jgi:ParB/RepB/Spo0J family partition protein
MRNSTVEDRLFLSIEQQGIHTPLSGIESSEQGFILLDGFKRYRAAQKLKIDQLPIDSIGDDFVPGFLTLLRQVNHSRLSALEEASFLRDLHTGYHLSFSEIARRVNRSVSWVSMRINLITTMRDDVKEKILQGKFPLRSYMYTLAPFTRVKNNAGEIRKFIDVTSGKNYSTRDIATLSKAFFSDDTKVKEQILSGNTDWTLQMLNKEPCPDSDATEADKIYYTLKSCRWHTAQILKHYRRSPELFLAKRRSDIFDFVISNCRDISELKAKEKLH